MDKIDRLILKELEANGRLSIVELAARVNLTNTPCSERVKRLERNNYIRSYRAVLDTSKLGLDHLTVVQVSLVATGNNTLELFHKAVRGIPEIESCLMVAGSFDYVLTVRTRNMTEFRDLLGDKINKLPGIQQTNSFAVMEVLVSPQDFSAAGRLDV